MCNFRCLALILLSLISVHTEKAAAQPQQTETWKKIENLPWQFGPGQGAIANKATIAIPKNYGFLSAEGTDKFLVILDNLPTKDGYTLAPEDLKWFSIFSFLATGYVKDDEKIDPDDLLKSLKEQNLRGNQERKARGLPELILEGWFISPHYDLQTKRLEWATKLSEANGEITVNYSIRLLSRSGVMSALLVSDPASLERDVRTFKATLNSFSFNVGENYSEFRTGDKIAEYGLAGLIIGGAAAAAAKTGLFKILGKFIWVIFIGIGALVLGVWRSLFGSKKTPT